MIYRVEVRKDGSIASCDLVESALKNGGLVCYIDAKTAAEACVKAKTYWSNVHTRAAARRECVSCKALVAPGKFRCPGCMRIRAEEEQARKRLKASMRPEQWAALCAENKRRAQQQSALRGAAVVKARTDII